MARRAYAILCATFGGVLCVAGLVLFAQFFRFHAPGGLGLPLLPMGPNGHYFVGFTGSALVAWVVGDYVVLGDLLRGEAALFLLLALAFVWLRPGRPAAGQERA